MDWASPLLEFRSPRRGSSSRSLRGLIPQPREGGEPRSARRTRCSRPTGGDRPRQREPCRVPPRRLIGRPRLPARPARALAWALAGFGLVLSAAASVAWPFHSSRHAEAAIRSLAVLPLVNLSGDPS